MTKPKLSNDDFCRAAKTLRCEVAAIKAVADTESRGEGFYSNDFPVILFERHKFRSFTHGKFNDTHPQISGPAGNYGSAGQNQRNKFNLAFKLDPEAAMKSCSWGKFQIMGFNHQLCGFLTVGAFVDAMKESEGRQLDAFVQFVIRTGLADELREKNWKGFAKGYNGAGYAQNHYDTKMAAAYNKFKKENIDCSQDSTAAHPSSNQTVITESSAMAGTQSTPAVEQTASSEPPPNVTEIKTTEAVQVEERTLVTEQTATAPKGDLPAATPTKVTTNGPLAKWLFSSGGALTIFTGIWGFIQTNGNVIAVAVLVLGLLIFALIFRGAITDAIRMTAAADPDKNNVT